MLHIILVIIEIIISIGLMLWTKHTWNLSWLIIGATLIFIAFFKQLWIDAACIALGIFLLALYDWYRQR